MINLNKLLFALLAVLISSTQLLKSMELQPKIATGSFKRLIDEPENRAPMQEVPLNVPQLHIPKNKFCTTGAWFATGGAVLGNAFSIGLGSALLDTANGNTASVVMGSLLIVGTAALDVALLIGAIKHRRAIIRENIQLEHEFIPHAQQAIVRRTTLPWHCSLSDDVVNSIYQWSKFSAELKIIHIKYLIGSIDIITNLTPSQEAHHYEKFKRTALAISQSLPGPQEELARPEAEPLVISSTLLHRMLPHAITGDLIRTAVSKYPLRFFNKFYFSDDITADKRGIFAESVAACACDVHLNNFLSIEPDTLTEVDKELLVVSARNAYFNKITTLTLPNNELS